MFGQATARPADRPIAGLRHWWQYSGHMPEADSSQEVWTVGRLLTWTTQFFQQRQVEGGRLAAELLLARAMNCRKIELYTRYETEPTAEQRAVFRELTRRAAEHTPIAYLLGEREFFSLAFEVTPAVLVPRPETETLVQRMIALCREAPDRMWNILDVGTGSGCIAVAVARYAANARLTGGDISAEALAVARRNVERHGLADRVRLVEADCVDLPADELPAGGFDAILSNPPYVSDADWPGLPPNVRDHEPRLALTGAGGDGLAMYRRLAAEGPEVLRPQGRLLVEIGRGQGDPVVDIFTSGARWLHVGTHRDRTDPHDRVLEFELRNG